MTMKTTLKHVLIALAFAAFLTLAPNTQAKMKATKDCAACCKQGGDCCEKCGDDKCAACCDKKADNPMMKDHLMMQGGKVMMMKGGKSMPLDKELSLSNGAKVTVDGNVTMKDGTKMMMKEGDMMTMDGEMMKHDMKEHPH
jgi:Domain of unknown function (DUF6799)